MMDPLLKDGDGGSAAPACDLNERRKRLGMAEKPSLRHHHCFNQFLQFLAPGAELLPVNLDRRETTGRHPGLDCLGNRGGAKNYRIQSGRLREKVLNL